MEGSLDGGVQRKVILSDESDRKDKIRTKGQTELFTAMESQTRGAN